MIYARRIRLRAAEREDIPRFTTWLNDPEVRRFLLLNLPMSRAEEERWFDHMLAQPAAEHVLVIEAKAESGWTPIGDTSLVNIDWVNRCAEVGIFIGEKSMWNQGYGRDAMKLMLRHAFTMLNLHRVYLRVYEHNVRAIRAYEHAGFVHEGRLRQGVYREGQYQDVLIMSVLQSEWQDSDF
jgi:diamine N-acetyltransferase